MAKNRDLVDEREDAIDRLHLKRALKTADRREQQSGDDIKYTSRGAERAWAAAYTRK